MKQVDNQPSNDHTARLQRAKSSKRTRLSKENLGATSFSPRKWLQNLHDDWRFQCTFWPWEIITSENDELGRGGPLNPLALGFLTVNNPIRKPCIRLVRWKMLEWLMLCIILANCVTLCLDSNRPGFLETQLYARLRVLNYFFIAAFTLEMVIKVTALGFVIGKHTYLRNGWNVLDFIVVIFGWLELLPGVGNYTIIRVARILRPLRLVTKIESLRILVECMLRSLPMLADVAILAMFFYAIFGIASVELLKGRMSNRCRAPDLASFTPANLINGTYQFISYTVSDDESTWPCSGPMASSVTWSDVNGTPTPSTLAFGGPSSSSNFGRICPSVPSTNPNDPNSPYGLLCVPYANPTPYGNYRHWDNILTAWLAIFQHTAPQDWSFIMYGGWDGLTWWTWPYNIIMVIIGAFLIQNLTLAILFLNFTKYYAEENQKARERAESIRMMSRRTSFASQSSFQSLLEDSEEDGRTSQVKPSSIGGQMWGRIKANALSLLAPLQGPWGAFRDLLYDLQETKAFDATATVMILLNAVVLALVWYPNYPDQVNVAVVNVNYGFTMFFLFEMLVKIGGLGPQRYCSNNYNLFDAAVTILGVIEMALALSGGQGNGLSALRALRLLRLFRLAKSWKSLNRMILVMLVSIKSVAWLTVLLILFIFMSGLLGMMLFGYNLESCTMVPDSVQLCPPGLTWRDCPARFDCYIKCDASLAYQWYNVPGSPYGGQAYCEVFPRRDPSIISPPPPLLGLNSSVPPPPQPPPGPPAPPFAVTDYTYSVQALMLDDASQFWAQVGKPTTPLFSQSPSYDYFYQAFLAVFVLLTQDNWAENNHNIMMLTRPWATLYCVIILVIGVFMLLNLFLAVLIANLDESTGLVKSETIHDHAEVVPVWSDGSRVHQQPGTTPFSQLGTNQTGDRSSHHHTAHDLSKHLPRPISHMSLWVPDGVQGKTGLPAQAGYGMLGSYPPPSYDDAKSQPSPSSSDGRGSIVKSSPARPNYSQGGSKSHSTSTPSRPPYQALEEELSFGNKIVALPPALMVSLDPLEESDRFSNQGAHQGQSLRAGSRLHLMGSSQISSAQTHSSATLGLLRSMFVPLPMIEESYGYVPVADKTYFGSRLNSSMTEPGRVKVPSYDRPSWSFTEWVKDVWNRDATLMIFQRGGRVQSFFYKMIHQLWFEYTMLFIVLLSCIELCFDDAMVLPGTKMAHAIFIMDIIFAVLFCLEALVKLIALGAFWCGPESYLRSGWNWLDLCIALVSVVIVILTATSSTNIIWLRSMRSLRALRPLKVARKVEGINVVVIAIGKALPAVGEITIIGLLFYYIFAVLAVNLMAGNFDYCADPLNVEIPGLDPSYLVASGNIDQGWCESNDGIQLINTSYYHSSINVPVPQWSQGTTWGANGNLARFDNVIMALWVLFQIGSLENWNNIMYFAMWSPQNGIWHNVEGQNTYISIFFLFFIVFGVFLILNMVIGVSINTFNKMKTENGRMAFLSKGQQEWLMLQRIMVVTQPKTKYKRPSNALRSLCYSFCMNEAFDYFMIAVILVNTVFMFLSHQGMSRELARVLTISNMVFTAIFVAEMLFKWMAIGLGPYFKDSWNRFDFFVVVVSVLGVILDFATTSNVTIFPLLRVLRVVRIIKLVPKLKGLKMMLITIYWSLPALGNVAAVLFVVLFIYSIIGMNIFGSVKPQQFLDEHANFETFPRAILMLLRFSTGENWNSVMYNCMVQEQCIMITETFNTSNTTFYRGSYYDLIADAGTLSLVPSNYKVDRCTPNAAVTAIYFCTYMMLVIFLLLQLVIGILIENIDNLAHMEEMQVSQKHIQAFIDVWEELDYHGTGYIDASDMTFLLMRVDWPMGVKGIKNPHLKINDIVQRLVIPLRNKRIHFLETMHALAGRVAGAEVPEADEFELHGQMITRLPKDAKPKYTLAEYYAAVYVRTSIRGFLTRAQLKILFDELEREMAEEEELAAMEEAPRLDGGGGAQYRGAHFPTIVEESSRLSGASSTNDVSIPPGSRPPGVPPSRFQGVSFLGSAEDASELKRQSEGMDPQLTEEPSRRKINDRLSKSRREIFRQVTTHRNAGQMVDVQSLIKQHQDSRFPRPSLNSTPLISEDSAPASAAGQFPVPPTGGRGSEGFDRGTRYDESEDHPSTGPGPGPRIGLLAIPEMHDTLSMVSPRPAADRVSRSSRPKLPPLSKNQLLPQTAAAKAAAGLDKSLSNALDQPSFPRHEAKKID